eukprot:TRINITY_DN94421_c0_g1_i1.p1 TRINITY_DN94421_c0_g1~~TRINITY_DN94421_c0_g1_i1.p1  ORF type:complete len:373 (+),score=28.70 TRINITY_DN94421_c0_g1_i1:68-1186(+)
MSHRPCCSWRCCLSSGEDCCCSGPCIQLPCFDKYAPNASCCCCCPPAYSQQVHELDDWVANILPQLHTGDAVLCSWPRGVYNGTNISRLMMHSRNTHIGVVYRPCDCPDVLTHRDRVFGDSVHISRPLLLQFVAGGECGHRRKTEKGGLELVDLETYLKDHADKFSHCPVEVAEDPSKYEVHVEGVRMLIGVNRDEQFYKNIEEVVNQYWDNDFELSPDKRSQLDLCECLPCCCCFKARNDTSKLICSEMAAEVYIRAGLISDKLNPSEMIPAHFDTTRKLRLRGGVALTKEHIFLGPSTLEERSGMGYANMDDVSSRQNTSVSKGPGGFFGVDCSMAVRNVFPSAGIAASVQQVAPAQEEMTDDDKRELGS